MANGCLKLSNVVMFGGVGIFGLLGGVCFSVWDRMSNDGRILSRIENLCNGFKQSAPNVDEQTKVKSESEADSPGDQVGEEKAPETVERPWYVPSPPGGSSLDRLIRSVEELDRKCSNEFDRLDARLDELIKRKAGAKCSKKPEKDETNPQ